MCLGDAGLTLEPEREATVAQMSVRSPNAWEASDLARIRNTISWEVVTAMSRRLPRVYHAAAGPVALRTLTAGTTGRTGGLR